MMEAAKIELARIEDAKENGYEIGLTKKYIDAFKKLNNDLLDKYHELTGGDAHSYYMETDPKYQDWTARGGEIRLSPFLFIF